MVIVKASYSTVEVAKAAGVGKSTILRWLREGKIAEPRRVTFGGVESRAWSQADLDKVKAFRAKHYRKKS